MPKITKKPMKNLKQTSIKSMLKRKVQSGNGDEDDNVDEVLEEQRQTVSLKNYEIKKTSRIKIPLLFMNPNDITQWKPPFYKVSDFCVSEFKARTNFLSVEDKNQYYGTSLVSIIISRPVKRLYRPPYQFEYNSVKQESYLKNLALLPNIKSKSDMKQYSDFYKKHGLKKCHVDMTKNNISKEFSDQITANFLKTNSEGRVWYLMQTMNHEILNSYYNSKNIKRKKLYSRDFTMETMRQYSNIEFVANKMIARDHRYTDFDSMMESIFFKYQLGLSPTQEDCIRYLKFNPYFEVVSGYDINFQNSSQTTISSSDDDSQPSTSKNLTFEFKKKPKVGTKSDKIAFTETDIDLTTIDEEDDVQQIVEPNEVIEEEEIVTSSFYSISQPKIVEQEPNVEEAEETEDEDNEEEKDEDEDKFNTIFDLLTADTSCSLVICIRDIIQSQKYLTATDWNSNMLDYVYDFLKTNMSLDILNYIKDYNSFTKDDMTDLIKDYLKINTETPDLTPQVTRTQPEITPLPLLEIIKQRTIPLISIPTSLLSPAINPSTSSSTSTGTGSNNSLNVDPCLMEIKPEQDSISINSDSELLDPIACNVVNSALDQEDLSIEEQLELLTTDNVPDAVLYVNVKPEPADETDINNTSSLEKQEKKADAENNNNYSDVEFVEICNEIVEIDSDSERSESMLCNEFNIIDDTIAKANSDMYLKYAEQATQEEIPVIPDVPVASSPKTVDSKLESSYKSITYQAHIDDQGESKKRKIANPINRVQPSTNQPAAKLIANKENITLRKNANVAVVVVPKPSSRNIYIQDDSSDQPGNIDFETHINEVLNHEFSVFLSSQIRGSGCDDERDNNESNKIHLPTINFTKQLNSDVNNSNPSAACFYVNIVGVKFQKDVLFQVTLNIPQFNFYSIDIENENIKTLLNLNNIEWKTLKDLLNLAVTYIYYKPKKEHVQKSSKSNSNNFTDLLDKFFDTSTSFKTFYLNSNNNSLVCYNTDGVPSCLNIDLSSAISPSILEAMRRLKATGSSI